LAPSSIGSAPPSFTGLALAGLAALRLIEARADD
jgi:hypothetical protein